MPTMRLLLQAATVLVLCLAGSGTLDAQWRSIGPGDGPTRAVAAYTSGGVHYLFAGSDAGLYRSTDDGVSWTAASGFPADELAQIRGEGQYVFAATLAGDFYRSTDYGATWAHISAPPLLAVSDVSGIAIDSNLVLATTYGSGPFVSYDFGATWTRSDSGLTDESQTAPLLFPSIPGTGGSKAPGPILAGSSGKVRGMAPANKGKGQKARVDTTSLPKVGPTPGSGPKWNKLRDSLSGPVNDMEDFYSHAPLKKPDAGSSTPSDSVLVLFAATFDGVYRSTDLGDTWVERSPGSFPLGLAVRDTVVYAGYLGNGVFSSSDAGATWLRDTLGMPNRSVWALAASDSGLYAATDNGIARLAQRGGRWTDVSTTLNVQGIYGLFANGSTLLCSTGSVDNLRSTDGGAHWQTGASGLISTIGTYAADSAYLYAGSTSGAGAFRSADGGLHWDPILTGLYPDGGQIVQFLRGHGRLYAGTVSGGIYVTTDQGDHWAQLNAGLPESNPGSIYIQAFGATDSVLFAVVGNRGMFRSTDAGATWVPSDTSFHLSTQALCLQSSGSVMYAGVLGKGVYKTTDRGLSWQAAATGLKDQTVMAMAASGKMVYAGSESGQIFGSANGGASWTDVGQGYIGATVDYLVVQGDMLYAGTAGASVWGRPLSEVTLGVAEGAQTNLPAGFSLGQNYPNPFNPATTILYGVPARAHVILSVFNTLGQKVAELVNGDIDAGNHRVEFNAGHLASGVYFYRMQAGEYTAIRKFCLIK